MWKEEKNQKCENRKEICEEKDSMAAIFKEGKEKELKPCIRKIISRVVEE